ncbi:MAG TPA: hypothetical protein H9694_04260 [Firmicutes bacterium]|nr:hypothetical protein [Bacillota bacterium]
MKWVKTGLLSLLLVIVGIFSWTAAAAEADGADFAVDSTIRQDTLRLELSGIPVENPRQLLSILVIHRDADTAQPAAGDILYANALYLNGRDALTLDIGTGGRDAREYRLIISDSTGTVVYSQLLDPEEPETTAPSEAAPSGTTATGDAEATTAGPGAETTAPSDAAETTAPSDTAGATGTTAASAAAEPTPDTPPTGVAPLKWSVVLAAAGGLIAVIVCWKKRSANGGAQ